MNDQEKKAANEQVEDLRSLLSEQSDEGHVHGPGCSHHHHSAPFVRSAPKVGRNDPCSCGSGKKFKKCCG